MRSLPTIQFSFPCMIDFQDIGINQDEAKDELLTGYLTEFMKKRSQITHYYICQQEYITFCAT